MKLLFLSFFSLSVGIFAMEQKDKARVPLEPLFSGSILDELNIPDLLGEETSSKDGFSSLPETPLVDNPSIAKEELPVVQHLPINNNDYWSMGGKNPRSLKKRLPGRANLFGYHQQMLADIAQDEKRMRQEEGHAGNNEKSLLPKVSVEPDEPFTLQQSSKKPKNVFFDYATHEEAEKIKSLLADQARLRDDKKQKNRKLKAIETDEKKCETIRRQCGKCKESFVSLYLHLRKSSCGKNN